MVVVVGVEGEVADDLSCFGVDDVDVLFFDEHGDVGSGMGSADADVVEFAGVAQGDGAGVSDDVAADPVVILDS